MTPATQSVLAGDAATFVAARTVGVLATADASGAPTAVPVCYAWDGADLWIALDDKPKRVSDPLQLRRARDLLARPQATLVVHDYLDVPWDELAHVIIHALGRIVAPGGAGHAAALDLLRAKYPAYRAMDLADRPAIALRPERVVVWGAVTARVRRPASLEATIVGRRSVRRFTAEPVARERIEAILEAARWAPSPHGRQPWRFAVITRPDGKERLAAAMGAEWETTLGQDGEAAATVARRLATSRERIRAAPAIILPCLYLDDLDHYPDLERQAAETAMATQSLGAAIQNMLLAAYQQGLDMGWMCAPLFCQPTVRAALDLPPSWLPQALLPLGRAAADPLRRPHRPVADLTRWD